MILLKSCLLGIGFTLFVLSTIYLIFAIIESIKRPFVKSIKQTFLACLVGLSIGIIVATFLHL